MVILQQACQTPFWCVKLQKSISLSYYRIPALNSTAKLHVKYLSCMNREVYLFSNPLFLLDSPENFDTSDIWHLILLDFIFVC